MKKVFLTASICLSACGGGGSDSDDSYTVAVPSRTVTIGATPADVLFDEASDTLTYTISDGSTVTLDRAAELDFDKFSGFLEATSGAAGFRAVSDNGEAFVNVGRGEEFESVVFGRTSQTNLPTAGLATYQGDYLGILTIPRSTEPEFYVTGSMFATADFNSSELILGTIDSRRVRSADTFDVITILDAVDFGAAPIDANGQITGDIVGDTRVRLDFDVVGEIAFDQVSGQYDALIASGNANDFVGGVEILYELDADVPNPAVLTETGAFIASSDIDP